MSNRPRRDSKPFTIGQSVLRSPPSTLDSPIQGVFNRRENSTNALYFTTSTGINWAEDARLTYEADTFEDHGI
jgi:hypothetical protein